MKKWIISFFFICFCFWADAQNNYDEAIHQGDSIFRKEGYKMAINKYFAAEAFDPSKKDIVKRKIDTVFNKIEILRLEAKRNEEKAKNALARALIISAAYLTSEAQKSFENEDIRLAWRLVEFALKYNPKNEIAIKLKKDLPGYSAEYFFGTNMDFSPDSSFILLFTQETDGSTTMNIFEPASQSMPRVFANSDPNFCAFSPNNQYLVFGTNMADTVCTINVLDLSSTTSPYLFRSTGAWATFLQFGADDFDRGSRDFVFYSNYNEKERFGTLNVLDLEKKIISDSFPNCSDYFFTDSLHLAFIANIDKKKGTGTLNILELASKKPPRTFPNYYLKQYYNYNHNSAGSFFFTDVNVTDQVCTLNVWESEKPDKLRTFPNCYYNGYNTCKFNNHSLVFFTNTNVKDTTWTLNVIDFKDGIPARTFPDCNDPYFKFSQHHLVFYTKVNNLASTLNILELENDKPLRSFPKTDNFDFSPDDRYLVYHTTNIPDTIGALNVLELDKEASPRSFSNVYPFGFKFSPDSRFLVFSSNFKDDTSEALNIFELGSQTLSHVLPNNREKQFVFSPDSRYLILYTVSDSIRVTDTLHVLALGSTGLLHTFPNINISRYIIDLDFSPDKRHLVFFTPDSLDTKERTLNILQLGDQVLFRSFPNVDSEAPFMYSADNHHFVFYTNVLKPDFGTLNILDLTNQRPVRSFPNTYFSQYDIRNGITYFSPDNHHLIFFSTSGNKIDTLNILKLDSMNPPVKFHNNLNYSGDFIYSSNGRYIAFQNGDSQTIEIFDIQSKKLLIREIKHKFMLRGMKFLNNDLLLTESVNNGSVTKLVRPSLGEKYWEYYLKEKYKPLTKEEKALFGITD